MEFLTVVSERHSIRAYRRKEVEPEKLDRILECANAAPSAGNLQAYEIVVVKDAARKRRLAEAAFNQSHVAAAPVVLVFFENPRRSAAKYGMRGVKLYAVQDATIACAYAQLTATALGLASCWVGAFDEAPVSEALAAPTHLTPVAILPIGYPDEKPEATDRRRIEDLVRRETFAE